MPWTPKLKVAEKQQGKIHVIIEYTDGTNIIAEDGWLTTPQTLNDVVASRVSQLNALDTYLTTLTVGAAISTTPTPVAALTQVEIDRNAWLVNYRKLEKAYRTLVVPGILPSSNPTYSALMSTVQTGLQAAYLDYI